MSSLEEKAKFISIGKIVGAHGVRGNVKIFSYAQSPDVFAPKRRLYLKRPDGSEQTCIVNWAKPHAKTILLFLEGIDTRERAEALAGTEVFVEKKGLPAPEEGSYYWFDIIGLRVLTVDGEELGRVDSILETGSNDVYVVKDPQRGPAYERLVPALSFVIRAIDLESKIMRVDLPEGL